MATKINVKRRKFTTNIQSDFEQAAIRRNLAASQVQSVIDTSRFCS